MYRRIALHVVLGLLAVPVGGCLWVASLIYDESHVTTYILHYPQFTVSLTEENAFMQLDLQQGAETASQESPFSIQIEPGGKVYRIFDLPEDAAAAKFGEPRVIDLPLGEMRHGYVWSLGGEVYPHAAPLEIARGEWVRLAMTNDTSMWHPMHLHGHYFRPLLEGVPIAERPLKHRLPKIHRCYHRELTISGFTIKLLASFCRSVVDFPLDTSVVDLPPNTHTSVADF